MIDPGQSGSDWLCGYQERITIEGGHAKSCYHSVPVSEEIIEADLSVQKTIPFIRYTYFINRRFLQKMNAGFRSEDDEQTGSNRIGHCGHFPSAAASCAILAVCVATPPDGKLPESTYARAMVR